jgi:2'-5' RNA ligase
MRAPWPLKLPQGRTLEPTHRHCTLAFLGNIEWKPLEAQLPSLPLPPFQLAPVGFFDDCLCLPPRSPRVVSWHVRFLPNGDLAAYQQTLATFLRSLNYTLDARPFLPHVTIARRPFRTIEWEESFKPLPCWVEAIKLYESIGNLTYKPLWSHPFTLPWTRIDNRLIITTASPEGLIPTISVAIASLYPDLTPSLLHLADLSDVPLTLLSLEPTRAVFQI